MLDMGFEPEIRKIVSSNYHIPATGKRQTLMFSATFPEEIQRIANEFLNNYLFLTVGRVGGATSDITQKVVEVDEFGKREKLSEILSTTGKGRRAGAPRVRGGGQGHHGKGWRAGAPRVRGGGQGHHG